MMHTKTARKISIHQSIIDDLDARTGDFARIAQATGIGYSTLHKIRHGVTRDIKLSTAEILLDWFEENPLC